MTRLYSLPEWLQTAIETTLKDLKVSREDSQKIADCVLRMSDFYLQNPESPTPWKESWCQVSQISYYLPLNFLRSQSVCQEAQARNFPLRSSEFFDFGSGLGAGSLPWLAIVNGPPVFVERSPEAQKLHQKLLSHFKLNSTPHWISEKDIRPQNKRTALFSYSLTELRKAPDWMWDCESLILLEPSTQDDGRRLLQFRKELQARGFFLWAPCPHQEACPLLEASKTDWCHDRIGFEKPDWFEKIERHLPIKNQTLTFGYLLASRQKPPALHQWRTVGDQLEEKGKTRQLICRNSQRQFLAWMHREGEVPEIPRGVLLDPPTDFIEKSNEVRVRSHLKMP